MSYSVIVLVAIVVIGVQVLGRYRLKKQGNRQSDYQQIAQEMGWQYQLLVEPKAVPTLELFEFAHRRDSSARGVQHLMTGQSNGHVIQMMDYSYNGYHGSGVFFKQTLCLIIDSCSVWTDFTILPNPSLRDALKSKPEQSSVEEQFLNTFDFHGDPAILTQFSEAFMAHCLTYPNVQIQVVQGHFLGMEWEYCIKPEHFKANIEFYTECVRLMSTGSHRAKSPVAESHELSGHT